MSGLDNGLRIFQNRISRQPGRGIKASDREGITCARCCECFETQRRQNSRRSCIPRIRDHEGSVSFMECPEYVVFLLACHCCDPQFEYPNRAGAVRPQQILCSMAHAFVRSRLERHRIISTLTIAVNEAAQRSCV